MPRPITKGPPIQFRLPVGVHEVIVKRSAARGETVADYIVRVLTNAANTVEIVKPGRDG